MATVYEEFCKTVAEHDRRDDEFDAKCRDLALAFKKALIDLGFPPENLRWVHWDDRSLDAERLHFNEVKRVLQDEGCDAATMLVRADDFFAWPVLKFRFEDGRFTLVVADKISVGADPEQVAREAAAEFVSSMKDMLNELPASWLRETGPKPARRISGRLGFRMDAERAGSGKPNR
jgi:hypothetical protein